MFNFLYWYKPIEGILIGYNISEIKRKLAKQIKDKISSGFNVQFSPQEYSLNR